MGTVKAHPHQLSRGQQQPVAISRAVVTNLKLVLADEPSGNLDSKNGVGAMNLLTQLNQEGMLPIPIGNRTMHIM